MPLSNGGGDLCEGYRLTCPCIDNTSTCLKSSGGGGATRLRPLNASEISGAAQLKYDNIREQYRKIIYAEKFEGQS